ncbi:MAG: DEAD/DEAH box helicase [Bacillota bacterium]
MKTAEDFITSIKSSPEYREQVVCVKEFPAREAVFGENDPPLPGSIVKRLKAAGIERLYSHQALAVQKVREGKSVVVVTSTASGKTLCYNLPVVESLLADLRATALYIFPTKALAQDQFRSLMRLQEDGDPFAVAGVYDGDTPAEERQYLKQNARIILTNPDMLHSGIMPQHPGWGRFFENLRYVVLDEIHIYRGVFGSQVANCLRRLKRISAHYGAAPFFICSSATIANPGELAQILTGEKAELIDQDGSPRGAKFFVLWNPPLLEKDTAMRKSSNTEAGEIMTELLRRGISTITFARARVVTELIYRYVQEALRKVKPSAAEKIRAYRGGYLPSERREIEQKLFSGELMGVTSTNALELGINVGSLEASLLVGFPGTIASTWQQAGRAGRGEEPSLAVLIAHQSPIDQFLMQHPAYFFGRTPEKAVLDPTNPHILLGQLRAAVYELPLPVEEMETFGIYAPAVMELLAEDGQVYFQSGKWYWCGRGYPASEVSLRNISEHTFSIMDRTAENARVIGTMDEASAYQQVFPQAVYMHDGETFFVEEMDVEKRVVYVRQMDLDYYTQSLTEVRILTGKEYETTEWNGSRLNFGGASIFMQPYMFRKIQFLNRDSIGYGKIDLPAQTLETVSFWLIPPLEALAQVRKWGRDPVDGLLGLANVTGEVLPFHAMCDVMDIGTAVDSVNTGVPTLYVYDKYPGGLGYALQMYERAEEILTACLDLIAACPCQKGCPSCVGSPVAPASQLDPDTNARGKVPDKEGALILLHALLGMEPYVPKFEAPAPGAGESRMQKPPPAAPLPEKLEMGLRQRLQGMKKKGKR